MWLRLDTDDATSNNAQIATMPDAEAFLAGKPRQLASGIIVVGKTLGCHQPDTR